MNENTIKDQPELNSDPNQTQMNNQTETLSGNNSTEANTENQNNSVSEIDTLKKENEELRDRYLRLASEFDNFRKRTQKEKADLIRYASEDVLIALLPVLDDFERAADVISNSDNLSAIKEGLTLIHHKLSTTLKAKGLKVMDLHGQVFNSDTQEVIASVPVEDETQKGKILETILKGYTLEEKVIRCAKVIIGE
jgi:molecular chaperone GrpE